MFLCPACINVYDGELGTELEDLEDETVKKKLCEKHKHLDYIVEFRKALNKKVKDESN